MAPSKSSSLKKAGSGSLFGSLLGEELMLVQQQSNLLKL
jgi:hypothetical protein